jgi:hypothetical protein
VKDFEVAFAGSASGSRAATSAETVTTVVEKLPIEFA